MVYVMIMNYKNKQTKKIKLKIMKTIKKLSHNI